MAVHLPIDLRLRPNVIERPAARRAPSVLPTDDEEDTVHRTRWRVLVLACVTTAAVAIAQPAHAGGTVAADGPITIQSGCTVPPCGDIHNDDDITYPISRQDCKGCGWIYSTIAPGQHKGGYWNDGIDWDRFGVPAFCTVGYTLDGDWRNWWNGNSTQAWVAFDSDETVRLKSLTC